jgi:hypothetical protein
MKNLLLLAVVFFSLKSYCQTQAFPANKIYPSGLMASAKNSQDALDNYNIWKTNFVTACNNGRYRIKFDNPSETVSEGIGYGMLLSVYAADKTLFDGRWWVSFRLVSSLWSLFSSS